MGSIEPRRQGKNTYYVFQETYRVKVNPKDSGKTRGSGKSKVCTRAIYLGKAGKILQCIQQGREPSRVKVRQFGLIAAAYQTACEIDLPQILMKYIQGKRCGIPRWIYFFVTIVNRLDHATSKNKMSKWLKKTILPELMGFDPKTLTSKNFWYATDEIICEQELRKRREKGENENDLLVGLKESVFNLIETDLFHQLEQIMGFSSDVICYDTTNFYTYIEEPKRSELANSCHSKASKHHLKHVGLLMAVENSYGIPIVSRIYKANRHDSKVFSFILADLILAIKKVSGEESNLVLILDKGNNSEENFQSMVGKISWVGSLVPSHYEDLIDLDISEYHDVWKGFRYYRLKRKVMNIECSIVLTFSEATKRKQRHSLKNGIEKLKRNLQTKWQSYKKPQKQITAGIKTMKKKSAYSCCIEVSVKDGQLQIDENEEEITKRKKRFGKSLIFSNMLKAESGYLIDTYIGKNVIEDDFKLLKDPLIIRFQPIRHWTDTKIRAFAFCCVISMTLLRFMQWKAEKSGYKMSPQVLKEELSDIEEVIMIYNMKEAKRKITDRSSVQDKLWRIFRLGDIEKKLLLQ